MSTVFDSRSATENPIQAPPQTSVGSVGIFEPPRGLVLTSISRHKRLVAIVTIIGAVLGLLAGIARKPTYTATSTLQVGTVNLNAPGFNGFVQGATSLSTVFSRAIFASSVLKELHSKLGIGSGEAARRLSAEPIPLSPSFDIIATGLTSKSAIALANTASTAVVSYEQKAASATSPQAEVLLKSYHKAAQELQQARALVESYSTEASRNKANALKVGNTQSYMPSKALIQAQTTEDEAKTRAEAIGAAYKSVTASTAGASPASGLISIIAEASTTTNNRKSKLQLYGLIGLFAGIIIGCLVAVLRERRLTSRAIAAEMKAEIHGSTPA